MKKKINVLLLVICLIASSIPIHASDRIVSITNALGEKVDFNIPNTNYDVDVDMLRGIADDHLDINAFTIYEIGYVENPLNDYESKSIFNKVKYYTDKKITRRNVLVKNCFVISVAKGQETTLTTTWKEELSYSISGSYYKFSNLGISGNVSKTYTKTEKFVGPPESSSKNSRQYRVKFYQNEGKYTQYRDEYDRNGNVVSAGFKKGTFTEPTRYSAYSFDTNES